MLIWHSDEYHVQGGTSRVESSVHPEVRDPDPYQYQTKRAGSPHGEACSSRLSHSWKGMLSILYHEDGERERRWEVGQG